MDKKALVIALDGPSGTGKSSVCRLVAESLGWHILDSGALYRLVALWSLTDPLLIKDLGALTQRLASHQLDFVIPQTSQESGVVLTVDKIPCAEIRQPHVAEQASVIATHPIVREALLSVQRDFLRTPGLVAEGRDMASVVFPQAQWRIFLDAKPEIRAKRRYNQLHKAGRDVNLAQLTQQIIERDQRDSSRKLAPLLAEKSARILDTSQLSLAQVVAQIVSWVQSH